MKGWWTLSMTSSLVFGAVVHEAEGAEVMHTGAQQVAIERLLNTGRVLYVAAHPDDENTRLLGYLANAKHLQVAYLSMTRGGGGQNLIGSEQAALLGVIRTQELLAARRIDGAEQRFTRARDFGYSKTAEETFATWGHDAILADVVWVIRSFRPDVVITRFTESPPNHGHHTASAILAHEAFEAAADPKRFPEQLERGVQTWGAQRLLLNVPRWGRDDDDGLDAYLALDVGAYDPRLGQSYGELAAASRSMHKSQGFGSAGVRGPIWEYFEPIAGRRPDKDLFEGIDTSWRRIRGATKVRTSLERARRAYRSDRPEDALPGLLAAYAALDRLAAKQPVPRVLDARDRTAEMIADAAGLYVRAVAERAEATPGSSVSVELEIVKRRPAKIALESIDWGDSPEPDKKVLETNAVQRLEKTLRIPADAAPSSPYWLTAPPGSGRYEAAPERVGEPEGPPARTVRILLSSGASRFALTRPVVHVSTDRVLGERERRFLILPPVTVTPLAAHAMLPNGQARTVRITARAAVDGVAARVALPVPKGWKVTPAAHEVRFEKAGAEQVLGFSVTAPKGAEPTLVRPTATVAGRASSIRYDLIDHNHIPVQAVLQVAELRLVPLQLRLPSVRVGYLPGSGDTVADDLRSVGLEVEEIDAESLRRGALERYGAIVIGVRAFNVRRDLAPAHDALMKWVAAGGTLVAQYNTSNRWTTLTDPVGPFPFQIDRERVTDENAPVTLVDPAHRLFSSPNVITAADFTGWVQERGLYFAKTWDERYRPLLEMNDAGEAPLRGALLVAKHGKGTFVYTGVSFFRQLPAGVPGAYRLLVNLVGLGAP